MNLWDHLRPDDLHRAGDVNTNRNGERVTHLYEPSRQGVVSFTRSGFARVNWDDGRVTDEWLADLSATPSKRVSEEDR